MDDAFVSFSVRVKKKVQCLGEMHGLKAKGTAESRQCPCEKKKEKEEDVHCQGAKRRRWRVFFRYKYSVFSRGQSYVISTAFEALADVKQAGALMLIHVCCIAGERRQTTIHHIG